jgi:hypothetical protein
VEEASAEAEAEEALAEADTEADITVDITEGRVLDSFLLASDFSDLTDTMGEDVLEAFSEFFFSR